MSGKTEALVKNDSRCLHGAHIPEQPLSVKPGVFLVMERRGVLKIIFILATRQIKGAIVRPESHEGRVGRGGQYITAVPFRGRGRRGMCQTSIHTTYRLEPASYHLSPVTCHLKFITLDLSHAP